MWKTKIFLVNLLVCVLSVTFLSTRAFAMEVDYNLTPHVENQVIHVEILVSNVSEEELVFRIGTDPLNLTLRDLNGNFLPFTQESVKAGSTEVTEIRVQPAVEEVRIEYYAKPTPDTVFFSEKWGYVGKDFGISLEHVLFLLPEEEAKATVTFNLPEGWVGVMARERINQSSYQIDGISTPYATRYEGKHHQGFVAFGPFNLLERNFDGHKLVMAIHRDIEFQRELEENTLKLVEYFQNVIGDYPADVLVAIILPAQAREIKGLGELVGMSEYASFFEVVPDNRREMVDVGIMRDFGYHIPSTWFGEFKPAPHEEKAFSWFINPWRFYYGEKAMVDVFNFSEEEYKLSLYSNWKRYEEENEGREILPIYEDSVLNNEKKIPLFGYTLNEEIKRVTNGEKSIDDVIRYMYENFALKGKEITSIAFLQVVNNVTNHDFTDFFDKYFYGTEKFPLIIEFEERGIPSPTPIITPSPTPTSLPTAPPSPPPTTTPTISPSPTFAPTSTPTPTGPTPVSTPTPTPTPTQSPVPMAYLAGAILAALLASLTVIFLKRRGK